MVQQVSFKLATKNAMKDILLSKVPLIQNLMKGMSLKVDVNLAKKVDDAIIEIIKFLQLEQSEAQNKDKGASSHGHAGVAGGDENKVEQHHLLHMISLALKTRMTATFDLNYPQKEQFKNNVYSLLPNDLAEYLKSPLISDKEMK